MKKLSSSTLGVVTLFSFAILALGLEVPPRPSGPIIDLSETLTREEIKSLQAKVADLSRTIGTPIAILLIPALAGDSLEDYSIRLAEKWKIGKDKGVLLLVVLEDRMVRIHVGSRLKGKLPDDRARAIISNEIAPRLRDGDFYGGISQGLSAIQRAVREKADAVAGVIVTLFMLFGLVLFILSAMGIVKNGSGLDYYSDFSGRRAGYPFSNIPPFGW